MPGYKDVGDGGMGEILRLVGFTLGSCSLRELFPSPIRKTNQGGKGQPHVCKLWTKAACERENYLELL